MKGWREVVPLLNPRPRIPFVLRSVMDRLERMGLRFCVDFGYQNAIDVLREKRREKRMRRGAVPKGRCA